MTQRYSRKKYFVHPSSQGTYLALSILPALAMSLICMIFLYIGGERILRAARENPDLPLYEMRETVGMLRAEPLGEEATRGVIRLGQQLDALSGAQESAYARTITRWNRMKLRLYIVLFFSLALVALLALQFSHRIAGPMINLKRNMDRLAAGEDTPPIHFRKYDEFKEVAAALENVRLRMHAAGIIAREPAVEKPGAQELAAGVKDAELAESLR